MLSGCFYLWFTRFSKFRSDHLMDFRYSPIKGFWCTMVGIKLKTFVVSEIIKISIDASYHRISLKLSLSNVWGLVTVDFRAREKIPLRQMETASCVKLSYQLFYLPSMKFFLVEKSGIWKKASLPKQTNKTNKTPSS